MSRRRTSATYRRSIWLNASRARRVQSGMGQRIEFTSPVARKLLPETGGGCELLYPYTTTEKQNPVEDVVGGPFGTTTFYPEVFTPA